MKAPSRADASAPSRSRTAASTATRTVPSPPRTCVAIGVVLRVEQLPATASRRRGRDAVLGQQLARRDRDLDFGAGGDQA